MSLYERLDFQSKFQMRLWEHLKGWKGKKGGTKGKGVFCQANGNTEMQHSQQPALGREPAGHEECAAVSLVKKNTM